MLLSDLRYTVRMLRKSPLFTLAVVLTVALGIGANTAIFSVVNAVMLRPLPYEQPGRLVWIAEKNDKLNLPTFTTSVLNYLSWKERSSAFERMGAFGFASFTLVGSGEPEQFTGGTLTPSLFPLLGIKPVLGRSFADGEDRPGSAKVVMISEALWKRRFGGERSIVGRHLTLNGADYLVVGIAPASLGLLSTGDMWIPMTIDPGHEIRLNHVILAVGRLPAGVTIEQAQAAMDIVAASVSHQYPEMKEWGIQLVSFYDWLVSSQLRTALVVLLCAVGCVLLIASVNVANLLLARAASREKEMAVRTALGAGRGRLLRQLLIESLTLSAIGGAAGLLAAVWAVEAIDAMLPPNLLPVPHLGIDTTVLVFAIALTVATGLFFGIAPAWHSVRPDLNAVLKQAMRGSGGAARPRLRNGLAAVELALATMLLIGAALLTQSLMRLQHVSLGFQPDRLLTFQLSLPQTKYPVDKAAVFYRTLLESLDSIPGVRCAAVSSGLPFGAGNYTTTPIATTGPSPLPPDTAVATDWRIVSPRFFHTMNIPLVHGRDFVDTDSIGPPQVIIVSQATARRFWGNSDPLGRTLHRQGDSKQFTVVGVVGDVRNTALNQESPSIYYPSTGRVPVMDIVVRTEPRPESILPMVRQSVHELDPTLPVSTVRTMDEWVSNSAAQPRLNAMLLGVFAGVAMLIAAIGIYGVLAYSVNQRTREIGVRLALGAPRAAVLQLVVREGMTVGAAGVAVGLIGALALSRALASLVFDVAIRDPLTYVSVSVFLMLVALAACLMPARRASRVDPMVALRAE
jgi:putative ABC transport system permease protein